MIAVSCGITISTVHHLVLSQYKRLTDGRTDRQTDIIVTATTWVALHAYPQHSYLSVRGDNRNVTIDITW